ncbi:MAG: Maf family protein [Thermoanaerobaculia bacterium]
MPRLVLASASPRRRELLAGLGLSPPVRPVDVDERPLDGEPAADCVLRLARSKAAAAAGRGELVLAADTLVVLDGRILGKPADPREAETMLGRLAGRDHLVQTGVAVHDGDSSAVAAGVETTRVFIAPLTASQIADYVATGEPLDKAGAYAIQGLGALFVERVDGNYSNVVGLPLPLTRRLFAELGFDLLAFGDRP